MRDEIGYLAKGNRKQVYSKTYFDVSEINTDLVKTYLFEAIEVDKAKLLKKIRFNCDF
jgi:hypothetical protein